jgi:hypothetical protein
MMSMTDRTRRRIGTVVLAPAAALAAWALIRLSSIDLDVSTASGTVGPADVFAAALIGALAAWLVARLFERHSPHPRRWWAIYGLDGTVGVHDRTGLACRRIERRRTHDAAPRQSPSWSSPASQRRCRYDA